MRILFTGGSSFTGFWFVEELRRAGHDVTCTFRGPSRDDYTDLRGWRVKKLCDGGGAIFDCTFGSEAFLEVVSSGPWDVYCHHAADVTNYRSMDFDVVRALASNTKNLRAMLAELKLVGCHKVMLTGSVFEGGEGAGSEGLPHIMPYGLSKALTAQVFEYEAGLAGLALGKFVIPNPIGIYQEPKFFQYLMATWREGKVAQVSTPNYVRDNIHVGLMALEYRHFLENLAGPGIDRRNPSGIVGEQGAFALLASREMSQRLGWPCDVELIHQTAFGEPRIRINTDPAAPRHPNWNLERAWDCLAEHYCGDRPVSAS